MLFSLHATRADAHAMEQQVGTNLLQLTPMVVDREEEQHVVAKMTRDMESDMIARRRGGSVV